MNSFFFSSWSHTSPVLLHLSARRYTAGGLIGRRVMFGAVSRFIRLISTGSSFMAAEKFDIPQEFCFISFSESPTSFIAFLAMVCIIGLCKGSTHAEFTSSAFFFLVFLLHLEVGPVQPMGDFGIGMDHST